MSEETDRLMKELKEMIDERQSLQNKQFRTAREKLAARARIGVLTKEISAYRKKLDVLFGNV